MLRNTDEVPRARAYAERVRPKYARAPKRSVYLTMRDGVRVAIDVHLPDAHGRFPTIVRQTRYFRTMRARPWVSRLLDERTLDPINGRMREFFVSRGYAWVDVDVRGSGASYGSWACPWSPDEVKDGREIVDWIVKQPWSNGKVGATGNSYDGTSADFLATTGHPALVAIAPRCSLYDVFTDVAYPGGLRQAWFTRAWTRANAALDANRPQGMIAEAIGQAHPRVCEGRPRRMLEAAIGALVNGVEEVDGEDVARALDEHRANMDVDGISNSVSFRDDLAESPLGPHSIDVFSPSTYAAEVRGSDVAVLGISGWFDAAYPHAAIKRHLTLGRASDKLLIGPWNHGCSQNASLHAPSRKASFHLDGEILRFFDRHLRGEDTGIDDEPSVRFFTMGAEAWRSSAEWPPKDAEPLRMYLRSGGRLRRDAPGKDESPSTFAIDRDARSGKRSRWRTLVSPFVVPDYRDTGRRAIAFTSDRIDSHLEMTGHAIATLSLRSDAQDGAVFVYLEELTADGRTIYVTEGQLRLVHHEVDEAPPPAYRSPIPHRSFRRASSRPFPTDRFVDVPIDLLPTSYRFSRGSRIRVSLAGADVDHFARVDGARRFVVGPGSFIELPIAAAARPR